MVTSIFTQSKISKLTYINYILSVNLASYNTHSCELLSNNFQHTSSVSLPTGTILELFKSLDSLAIIMLKTICHKRFNFCYNMFKKLWGGFYLTLLHSQLPWWESPYQAPSEPTESQYFQQGLLDPFYIGLKHKEFTELYFKGLDVNGTLFVKRPIESFLSKGEFTLSFTTSVSEV